MGWFAKERGAGTAVVGEDRTVSPQARREYDAFGPWTVPVRAEEDLPPRFHGAWAEHGGALFLLKVPRDIERREARPGDDLYRSLLAVHEDRVCLLSLVGSEVETRTVPLDKVGALVHTMVLLAGELVFVNTDGTRLSVPYNTSSAPVMLGLIDEVRRRISVPVLPTGTEAVGPVGVKNYYFQKLIEGQKVRHPENHPLFCEEPGPHHRSPGLLVFRSGVDLTLVSLRAGPRSRVQGQYGTQTVHVARNRLTGVSVTSQVHRGWRSRVTREVGLHIGDSRLDFPLVQDPSALAALLEASKGGA